MPSIRAADLASRSGYSEGEECGIAQWGRRCGRYKTMCVFLFLHIVVSWRGSQPSVFITVLGW